MHDFILTCGASCKLYVRGEKFFPVPRPTPVALAFQPVEAQAEAATFCKREIHPDFQDRQPGGFAGERHLTPI